MYADRLEAASTEKRSIRERLNGNVVNDSIRRRQVTGKRQRQDDKWEHDLYEDEPEISARKLGARDLRLKLQKKTSQLVSQTGSVRDLREKLSGSMHPQPVNNDPPKQKPVPEAVKPSRKSVIVEAPATTAEMISKSSLRKKTQQKADVEGFLQSLGLEKYLITFQAEEVDMTALEHMTDEDLKAMGIPMGPRKKILLVLNSKG